MSVNVTGDGAAGAAAVRLGGSAALYERPVRCRDSPCCRAVVFDGLPGIRTTAADMIPTNNRKILIPIQTFCAGLFSRVPFIVKQQV
jgi:hypothetical protein